MPGASKWQVLGSNLHRSPRGPGIALSLRDDLSVVNLDEELGSDRAVVGVVRCDHKTVKVHLNQGTVEALVRLVKTGGFPPAGSLRWMKPTQWAER
jgi:hypothetical protein